MVANVSLSLSSPFLVGGLPPIAATLAAEFMPV
jgi:hypothetical protein